MILFFLQFQQIYQVYKIYWYLHWGLTGVRRLRGHQIKRQSRCLRALSNTSTESAFEFKELIFFQTWNITKVCYCIWLIESDYCQIVLWSFLVNLCLNININNYNKSRLQIFISILSLSVNIQYFLILFIQELNLSIKTLSLSTKGSIQKAWKITSYNFQSRRPIMTLGGVY